MLVAQAGIDLDHLGFKLFYLTTTPPRLLMNEGSYFFILSFFFFQSVANLKMLVAQAGINPATYSIE